MKRKELSMNKRMAATVSLAMITSVVGSSASSFGATQRVLAPKVTITVLGADYGSGPSNTTSKYWQTIAQGFMKLYPNVTVKTSTINWNDYNTKVTAQIQNKNYPDILQGEFFPQYVSDGLLYPLSKVLTNPNAGSPVFTSSFSIKNVQYAMPFVTSARAMFYNKKLFAQAKIAGPPKTWAELKTDAMAIAKLGKIGYSLPLGPEEAQAESYLWMLGSGGGWQNAKGQYTINSKNNLKAFGFLKQLVASGATNPDPATWNRTADSAKAFANGQVGMEFNGPFLTATIAAAGVLKSTDYATAPIPGATGPVIKTLGVADAIQVFKSSAAKLPWIKKFMDYATDNANQLAFAKEYALLPGTVSALNTLKNDPVLGSFVQALPHTVLFPSSSNWTSTVLPAIKIQIGTAVTGNASSVLDQLQSLATGG